MEPEPEVQTRWIGADSILYATTHRPWPPPQGQWVMTQTWHDLLFAHYRVPVAALRQLVPWPLALDLYGGEAWLSVTPFWIGSLRPPGIPPLPKLSHFCELNVRTYVSYGGKPGVFFFSLDAGSLSAVWGARTFYRLPYWHAAMRVKGRKRSVTSRGGCMVRRPREECRVFALFIGLEANRGSTTGSHRRIPDRALLPIRLEPGKLYRAEIHHLPWPLQPAETEIEINTMAEPLGLSLPVRPDLAQFARLLKVLVWAPEKLRSWKESF